MKRSRKIDFRVVRPTLLLLLSVAVTRGAGLIDGSVLPVPQGSNVDLSTVGTVDWVHWGLFTDSSLNRKAGVAPLIGDFTLLQGAGTNAFVFPYQYEDNFNGYSWSDGFPVAAETNTPTGVWAYGIPAVGTGFEFSVPADTSAKTLRVFVGAFSAVGSFEAFLSDESAPPYLNTSLTNSGNGPGVVYTVNYAAATPGQSLVVRWKLQAQVHSPGGARDANVTLQAATLSTATANNPPAVYLTEPSANASFVAPAAIDLAAKAFDLDGSVVKVEFFNGTTRIGQEAASPYRVQWSSVPSGHYCLTAVATDNAGGTRTSPPVEVFVHGSGGSLAGVAAPPPSSVDLTAEGTRDWSHWGLLDTGSFNHKAGVAAVIGNFTLLGTGSVHRLTDSATQWSWSDGTPTERTNNTTTGIYFSGMTNGFELTLPADPVPRTVRIYTMMYGCAEDFQAWLTDFSATPFFDTSFDDVYGSRATLYTLTYAAASTGQSLKVRFRNRALYDFDYGYVALLTATMPRPAGPSPVVLRHPMMIGDQFSFSFETESSRIYRVQLKPGWSEGTTWTTLTNVAGTGADVTVSDPSAAGTQRAYRVETQ